MTVNTHLLTRIVVICRAGVIRMPSITTLSLLPWVARLTRRSSPAFSVEAMTMTNKAALSFVLFFVVVVDLCLAGCQGKGEYFMIADVLTLMFLVLICVFFGLPWWWCLLVVLLAAHWLHMWKKED